MALPDLEMECRAGVGGGEPTVKHQICEDQGVEVWEGSPSSMEARSRKGLCPSPENFLTSEWKMVRFGALSAIFCRLQSMV